MFIFFFNSTKVSLTRPFLGVWRINLCFVANRLYDEVKMTAFWLHVFLRIYFRILPTIQSRNQIPLCRGYSQSSLYMFERRLRAVPLQSVESKLDRTGESEMAQRETGFYFRSLRSISSLAWPSWRTALSLVWTDLKHDRKQFPLSFVQRWLFLCMCNWIASWLYKAAVS